MRCVNIVLLARGRTDEYVIFVTNALTDLVVELDGKVVGYLTESRATYHKSLLARVSVISAFRDDTNADNLRPMFSQVIILPVPGFQNCFPSLEHLSRT